MNPGTGVVIALSSFAGGGLALLLLGQVRVMLMAAAPAGIGVFT